MGKGISCRVWTLVPFLFLLAGILFGCLEGKNFEPEFQMQLPETFPEMPIPEDNQLTQLRVELGRKLFSDPMLSADSSMSCATCHRPQFAFADTVPLSLGVHGLLPLRNTPSLMNVAWQPYLHADGGRSTLENQVIAPLEGGGEMGFNLRDLVERLQADGRYNDEMTQAYGRHDHYAMVRAIATFQRSLVSGQSAFDRAELNQQQLEGQKLFGEHCQSCHSGFNFTNYEFLNNGLELEYADAGRGRITFAPEDSGTFKVPGLRNVELTAPYMHDGSMRSLEEVVAHYNRGGAGHRNQDPRVKPLELDSLEQQALVAFLKGLTDQRFQ